MIIVTDFFKGCRSNYRTNMNTDIKNKKIVIGLSLPSQREERWVIDKIAMEKESKAAGVELKVRIADIDAAQQASQIDELISEGIDVLIIGPEDANLAAASVEKARKAGIKVISYERLVLNTDLDLYIVFDNEKMGGLLGEYLTKAAPKGNYIFMSGPLTDFTPKLVTKGGMKFIQPLVDKGDIKIVVNKPIEKWLPINAYNIVEDALAKTNNNIQGIYAPNDETAGAAIVALSKHGLEGNVPVVGNDGDLLAIRRIIKGTQLMTVFKDSRELGKIAIINAIKLANGEKITPTTTINNGKMDVPTILLDVTAVDKTNIDKVLIDSGYMTKEDIYETRSYIWNR